MNRTRHNIALSFLFVLVFFLILEGMLALFWPHKILLHTYHEEYHPVMGWVNKPNTSGDFYRRNRGIFFYRTHNGHGLRALREIPYEKPAGVKRVLLIGDSFFWGYGVNDKDIVSEVLQKLVGGNIEIINGAVTGYGTDQELLWLEKEGVKYKPDLVILGAFPTNDMDEISHSVVYGGYPKPYFSLDGDRLVLHNVPVPDTRETRRKAFEEPDSLFDRLKHFLRHHTHTYTFLVNRINALPGMRNFLLKIGLAEEFTPALPGVPNVTLEPGEVLPLYKALIKEMKAVSVGAGADFLLIFIPEKEQTPGAPEIYEGVSKEAMDNNTNLNEGMFRFAKREKIPYLSLLTDVRQRQKRGQVLYFPQPTDHHWTPAGHRVAAEAIARFIEDEHALARR